MYGSTYYFVNFLAIISLNTKSFMFNITIIIKDSKCEVNEKTLYRVYKKKLDRVSSTIYLPLYILS